MQVDYVIVGDYYTDRLQETINEHARLGFRVVNLAVTTTPAGDAAVRLGTAEPFWHVAALERRLDLAPPTE